MLSLNSSYSFANLMDPLLKKSKTHNFCMYHSGWICMCVGQWVVDLVDRQICCKYNNISPQMRLTLRLNLRLVKEVGCLSKMCAFGMALSLKYLDKSDNYYIKRQNWSLFTKCKFYKNLQESQIPQYPASKLHFSERLRCTLCENVFGCCSYLLHFL